MFSFLSHFGSNTNRLHTVIVMDAEQAEPPRQYQVRPKTILLWMSAITLCLAALMVLLIMSTPLRELVPGYGADGLQQTARINALRLAALQDSLAVQQQYMRQLQHLVTGEIDTALIEGTTAPDLDTSSGSGPRVVPELQTPDWADHAQPALPMVRLESGGAQPPVSRTAASDYISSLQLPILPPIGGFITRGFDARTGHFAVDIAAEEGTFVRSIGDGYVIFADWTQEGGEVIAIQHTDGYISIFKHNQQLLKRVGDRVRNREAVALSGNSGEVTTGPHLHFEMWLNGLAQDPRTYIIGW
jgi:murein DD-endopeptidase MepM/ murein hydrolase activator NlpD